MNAQSFSKTISVKRTAEEAFAAIQNVRGWWTGEIEGTTDELGGEFTYRYKDIHYSKQKLVEAIAGKKVVWLITDASLNFAKDRTEWKGTRLCFDISTNGGETEVRFTHDGLVQEHACFEACSNAWTFLVGDNLRSLITGTDREPR